MHIYLITNIKKKLNVLTYRVVVFLTVSRYEKILSTIEGKEIENIINKYFNCNLEIQSVNYEDIINLLF